MRQPVKKKELRFRRDRKVYTAAASIGASPFEGAIQTIKAIWCGSHCTAQQLGKLLAQGLEISCQCYYMKAKVRGETLLLWVSSSSLLCMNGAGERKPYPLLANLFKIFCRGCLWVCWVVGFRTPVLSGVLTEMSCCKDRAKELEISGTSPCLLGLQRLATLPVEKRTIIPEVKTVLSLGPLEKSVQSR